jgi:hypothetical protein
LSEIRRMRFSDTVSDVPCSLFPTLEFQHNSTAKRGGRFRYARITAD